MFIVDTDFLDVVTGVLQGDMFEPYLLIINQDYVLRTFIDLLKENRFKLKKMVRSRQDFARTITGADSAHDIALLANTYARAESLLHSLELGAGGISLQMNTNKRVHVFKTWRSNRHFC